jgi:two-component system NtrC family sensor kinase
VKIEITDSGHGIPAAAIEHIFEPFFTTKPASEGTGLGLPISRWIVEKLGGRIEVESREGEGTSFHVTLPAQSTPDLDPRARHVEDVVEAAKAPPGG